MVRTPEEIKQLVLEWLKQDGIKHQEEQLIEQQAKTINWIIRVTNGVTALTVGQKRFPDRITIQTDIKMSFNLLDESKTKEKQKNNDKQDAKKSKTNSITDQIQKQINSLVPELTNNLTLSGISFKVLTDKSNKNFEGVRVFKFIQDDALNKDRFLQDLQRVKAVLQNSVSVINSLVRSRVKVNISAQSKPQESDIDAYQ